MRSALARCRDKRALSPRAAPRVAGWVQRFLRERRRQRCSAPSTLTTKETDIGPGAIGGTRSQLLGPHCNRWIAGRCGALR